MKPGYKGFKRLWHATVFSGQGLRSAWKNEQAFRMEVYILLVATPLAAWLADSAVEFLVLMIAMVLVLVAELLNTSIESAVDRMGSEVNELSGQAKDQASAAVFVAMLLCLLTWLVIIGSKL